MLIRWHVFGSWFYLNTFFATWMQGSFYIVEQAVVIVLPDIFKDIYHFNELQMGLTQVPRGVGIIGVASASESSWTITKRCLQSKSAGTLMR